MAESMNLEQMFNGMVDERSQLSSGEVRRKLDTALADLAVIGAVAGVMAMMGTPEQRKAIIAQLDAVEKANAAVPAERRNPLLAGHVETWRIMLGG